MVSNFSIKKEDSSKRRVKARKKWNNEGVASTVGTIMALMVFLAFLSMFTNQYVPVWMEDNESSHMNTVKGQFASLKQAIDLQILGMATQGYESTMYTPITLGANGIPIFASPTPGFLGVYSYQSYNNVSFSFDVTGAATPTIIDYRSPQQTSTLGGTILLEAPNRYFVKQTYVYENDAIILKQADGSYMVANPQFDVRRSAGGRFDISYTQIDLRGDDQTYVGFGTRGIQTTIRAAPYNTYTNLTSVNATGAPAYLYINQTTHYASAWISTFNKTLSEVGMTYGPNTVGVGGDDYFLTTHDVNVSNPLDMIHKVELRINPDSISDFTFTTAHFEIVTAESGVS